MTRTHNPAHRKRCANSAWAPGRRVRILSDAFGYGGKVATIRGVGEKFVYVEIKLGRKPEDRDAVAYPPADLRLIARNGS